MPDWIHSLMQALAMPELGLSTVFVVSFLSATLLPLGSEAVVFGLLKLNPDLFWPTDRSWFAATDVDFWSLYVGGSTAFTSELATYASTPCEFVDNDDHLPIEN